jgi:hypothetical protein
LGISFFVQNLSNDIEDKKWQASENGAICSGKPRISRKRFPSQSKTFTSKPDAEAWVRAIESEMDRGIFVSRVEAEKTMLSEALDRYSKEITVHKRGKVQETSLIKRWKITTLAARPLASLRGGDFAKYRDNRKAENKSSNTIRIELALIGHLFETARREWGMEGLRNPIRTDFASSSF